jgi:hypothetical protein
MVEIEKRDWEDLHRDAIAKLKGAMISVVQFEKIVEACKEEINKFPDETPNDEASGAIEELTKELD